MNRMGITDDRQYERMEQFAFECYQQELKLRSMASIEVYREVIPPVGVINLPPDYIRYTKIGICRGGRIYTLTLDETLCKSKPQICASLEQQTAVEYPIAPHYFNGVYYGYDLPALFMAGGGVNRDGYYRVDDDKKVIYLDSKLTGTELIVEYQSSGNVTGQTLVPEMYIDPMRYYIAWKMYEYDPQMVQLAEREYQRFAAYFTEAGIQRNMFTLDELLDVLYETSGWNIR